MGMALPVIVPKCGGAYEVAGTAAIDLNLMILWIQLRRYMHFYKILLILQVLSKKFGAF